jgi:hypothetical protein
MSNSRYTREQKRISRVTQTRNLIVTKGLSGLLNNTKWYQIFEWIEQARISFDIKLLSEVDSRHCSFIKELEDTSILADDKGDFVEFLEIESLTFKRDKKLVDLLDKLGAVYLSETDNITVRGYNV